MTTPKRQERTLKLIPGIVGALLVAAALPVAAENKLGFVNTERIFRDAPPAVRAQKKLEKEFEPRDKELQRMAQQLQKLQEGIEKDGVTIRGAIAYIRVFNGTLKVIDKIKFFVIHGEFEAEEVAELGLSKIKTNELAAGNVGYLIAGSKDVHDTKVGDTVTHVKNGASEPLPGYKIVKPMVYSGLYPTDSDEFENLRDALEKFRLNDSALVYQPETSAALGFGFRCGFLGMLHMEIVQERLLREYGQSIITTLPNVEYQVYKKNGQLPPGCRCSRCRH